MSTHEGAKASPIHLMFLPPRIGRVSLFSRSIGGSPYLTLPQVKQVTSGVPWTGNMRPWQRAQRGKGRSSLAIATSDGQFKAAQIPRGKHPCSPTLQRCSIVCITSANKGKRSDQQTAPRPEVMQW
jgi:hypothetical protein